jgi:hypothetical protein
MGTLLSIDPKILFTHFLEDCVAIGIANVATAPSIGHFKSYTVRGQVLPGDATSRVFNASLRAHGYRKVMTKCWNQRPAFWLKR